MASVVRARTPSRTRARSDIGSLRCRRRAAACRAPSAFVSRTETEAERSHLRGVDPEPVPDAADRVDQGGLYPIELLAEVGDVRLDHVGVAAEVVLPHVVEDLRLRQ